MSAWHEARARGAEDRARSAAARGLANECFVRVVPRPGDGSRRTRSAAGPGTSVLADLITPAAPLAEATFAGAVPPQLRPYLTPRERELATAWGMF